MKIGKYEITKGPNIYWWIATACFMYPAVTVNDWWFIGGWILFNIVLIPICLYIHKRKEKSNL